jgi:hypothetical protein
MAKSLVLPVAEKHSGLLVDVCYDVQRQLVKSPAMIGAIRNLFVVQDNAVTEHDEAVFYVSS